MTPRIGSLFSGYGGLDIAVSRVYGGEVVWYSEIDKHACTVLAARHPGVLNLGDITAVDWATVPPIDILTGGYPCQPFSHAGQRKGTNDERHLWPYVRDAIVALRPVVTVLENVDGHRSLGLDVVLGDLADLGLSARWGVVRAADAGAPHGRKRVFIVVTTDTDHVGSGGLRPALETRLGRGSSATARRDVHAADADRDRHGSELHAGGMAGVEGQAAGRTPERQRARGESDAGSDQPAADATGCGSGAQWASGAGKAGTTAGSCGDCQLPAADAEGWRRGAGQGLAETAAGRSQQGVGDSGVAWGKYAPAIRRWESVLGRPAPAPTVPGTNGRPRLSPYLVEWMMGLEPGHVTGHGLKPAACLKMLGNGVVPQQAELALRMLAVADA